MIDAQRNWQALMQLAEIIEPDKPYTRRSFSPRFVEGRAWLEAQMRLLGLQTRIDSAGNLIGRLKGNGSREGVIAVGSHSDSVPNGGRFDGIAGVLAALACVHDWQQRGLVLNHDVEVIDYLAEEPSEWGLSCIGSRAMTGHLSAEMLALAHPQTGETLAQAITRMGGCPEQLSPRQDIVAAFELHIEQGKVLESEGIALGVVSGIVGIVRVEVLLQGQANHAGTTPMSLRQDALTAAAEVLLSAEKSAQALSAQAGSYFVATGGQLFVEPNASNVIAGACRLVFDIRSDTQALLDSFVQSLTQTVEAIAQRRQLPHFQIKRLSATSPVQSDITLMTHLWQAAQAQGVSAKVMPSGAGHDAAFLAKIAPMAMLFVPSVEGKSHCPEEWTDEKALTTGINVLCAAIEAFDKS